MDTKGSQPATKKKENGKKSISQIASIKIAGSYDDSAQSIFRKLSLPSTPEAEPIEPISGLDREVSDIFQQAADHRDRLINFFIRYTWVFSIFVATVIIGQAAARALMPGMQTVELIPYWALNLLVVGLIGQFITLLTIVTKKVWLFEEFFKHADSHHGKKAEDDVHSER
jgi:hypothetical protein